MRNFYSASCGGRRRKVLIRWGTYALLVDSLEPAFAQVTSQCFARSRFPRPGPCRRMRYP